MRWSQQVAIVIAFLALPLEVFSQDTKQKPVQKKVPEESPYVIELQETRVRFENDGTGAQEVHVRSRVQTQKGAQQLSQLAFRYARASAQLEINSIVVHKPGGGSMEILPSAIVDRPAEEVRDASAYEEAREKAVRVPAVKPGDVLEYRVTTTIIKPSAPDQFWFAYDFSREAPPLEESLEIDVPAGRDVHWRVRGGMSVLEAKTENESGRVVHRWKASAGGAADKNESPPTKTAESTTDSRFHDVQLTTFSNWEEVARWLWTLQPPNSEESPVAQKAAELTQERKDALQKLEALYTFVATKIRTIPLPPSVVGWKPLPAAQVLKQGYGTSLDKHALLAALAKRVGLSAVPMYLGASTKLQEDAPLPAQLTRIITVVPMGSETVWLDTAEEVAPFRMLASSIRNKSGLALLQKLEEKEGTSALFRWLTTPVDPPFPATQTVTIASELNAEGKLTSRVTYALRGDAELLLRITFHNTPEEQWKTIGLLLAFADGLRGTISNVVPSNSEATADPFRIEFQIAQEHAAKWLEQKASLALPLPGIGLPDLPENSLAAPGGAAALNLGTPLDIRTRVTIALPPGVNARAPFPVSVKRDYAEFRSTYRLEGNRLVATRDLRFLLRELPASRLADYSAFVRAVRNDEAQVTALERAAPPVKAPAKTLPFRSR